MSRVITCALALTACGGTSTPAPIAPVANERQVPEAKQVAPNCFEMDRDALAKALASWSTLAESATVRWIEGGQVPHLDKGKAWPGVGVSDIQAGSIYERMGLRNGDVVFAIDGHALLSFNVLVVPLADRAIAREYDTVSPPSEMLDTAFSSAGSEVVSLGVVRDGQTLTLNVLASGAPVARCDTQPKLQERAAEEATWTDADWKAEEARIAEVVKAQEAADAEMQAVVAGITKVNATTFEIAATITAARLRSALEGSRARFVPAVKNGQPDGVKIFAVRATSPYAALGVQNGDTLRFIAGVHVESADAALDALARIAEKKTATIELTRRGAPVTLMYSVK